DELRDVVGGEAELSGLRDEWGDVGVGEGRLALAEHLLASAGGDEHADSAALVEDPFVDEHVHSLGCGCGVDTGEGGDLVRRRRLVLFSEGAVDDLVLDHLGDLHEERLALVHASSRGLVVSYPTNEPHKRDHVNPEERKSADPRKGPALVGGDYRTMASRTVDPPPPRIRATTTLHATTRIRRLRRVRRP